MKYRTLGSQDGGLKVSAIGIGCMPMIRNGNINYGHADDDESIRTIHEAIELGITFFDTAEMYGPFANEELVGQAIKGKRDGLVIATKFAMRWNGNEMTGLDGSPANARRAVEGSLKRLGIDTIDLFYQHRVDPNVPIEETVGGMAELIKEGKIRHIALSEAGPETIRRAHAVFPVTALQTEYSLFTREPEACVLPLCRELGIGFVAYSPLGRGFLAGAGRTLPEADFRKSLPRWQGEALNRNLALYERLEALARARSVTVAQFSLAWLLHQGSDIVPIPGTTKVHRLDENAAAADIVLTTEELAAIADAMPPSAVVGDRYDSTGAALIER